MLHFDYKILKLRKSSYLESFLVGMIVHKYLILLVNIFFKIRLNNEFLCQLKVKEPSILKKDGSFIVIT